MRLSRLFKPRSIAIVGGGAWGAAIVANNIAAGFAGDIWPVHPSKETVGGLPCFKSLSDLPNPPDAIFIGVNRNLTVDIVAEARALGCGGAVCFAAGFSEAEAEAEGSAALEATLLDAAGDMPIIGPNCYGYLNYLDRAYVWPDQHGGLPVDSGVAILTQSSNIAINLTMQMRGLPIAFISTAGNQAQTGLAQMAAELLADPRITALGLHIEGIDDIRAFEALAAQAHALNKPIVSLKVGASDQAQAATISHTASLAGSQAGSLALLRRLGIAAVDDLSTLLETLKILHIHGPLPHSNIGSMSCSGGEASLMADMGAQTGVFYPALNPTQHQNLRDALGPMVKLSNPLDYHTYIWRNQAAMAATFSAMAADHIALSIVVADFPRADRCSAGDWDDVIAAVDMAQQQTGRPYAILASLTETMPEEIAAQLTQLGIIPMNGMAESLRAIKAAVLPKYQGQIPVALPASAIDPQDILEAEAKAQLAAYGVPVAQRATANSPSEAAHEAEKLGFPVVLKSIGLAHKSDAGGVVLNLSDADAVRQAAETMPAEAFLIEQMITDSVAEVLVGVLNDPAHGYVLTLGAGGVLTELLNDTASLIIPASGADIEQALGQLKIARLLNGYRGAPTADIPALVNSILAVQDFVLANSGIAELEINPMIATPTAAFAADALIRKGTDQ